MLLTHTHVPISIIFPVISLCISIFQHPSGFLFSGAREKKKKKSWAKNLVL